MEEDPLSAAAEAGRDCLHRSGLTTADIGALLVTSEAPPLLVGLAAALHYRLDLRPGTVALEIGGACTGFLAALWLARSLLASSGPALVIALEAPSRYLELTPGRAGEASALFGDAAAASLICNQSTGRDAVPLRAITLGTDGAAGQLLQVQRTPAGQTELRMDGERLAGRAVRAMAQTVRDLLHDCAQEVQNSTAVVAHGGNGRMSSLLARQLGLPAERIWSETRRTGNLGSASLPVAWCAHQPPPAGPVAWVAVGAGLTYAAALTGTDHTRPD
jgi:3-oxoacyl-[acyl-carrier-protein] synthase-3